MIDLSELGRKYPYKTELHAHTKPISSCSHVSAEELVEIYSEYGCHTIVITNHLYGERWTAGDPFARAEEYLEDYRAAKSAGKKCGLTVLLGVEIRFPENKNDYLIYGVSEADIPKFIGYLDSGIEVFYKECKTDTNLILQAHPFRDKMVPPKLGSLDGIESFNLHPNHNSRIGMASRYARENGLIMSGGTDFHEAPHKAMCLMRTAKRPEDSFDVSKILRSRDYFLDISGNYVFISQE